MHTFQFNTESELISQSVPSFTSAVALFIKKNEVTELIKLIVIICYLNTTQDNNFM